MAIIPLKQTVTITRKGTLDEWGESTGVTTFKLKCRVEEGAKLIQNRFGAEVVSGAEITFDKLADIRYEDVIEFTNELGFTITQTPIKISPTRGVAGKALLTTVYI